MAGSAEKRRDVDNMKKKRLLRMVAWVMLACLTLTLCACNDTKDYSEKIVGEWEVPDYPGSYICFRADGSVDADPGEGDGFDNRTYWEVQGTELSISDADRVNVLHIVSLTNDKMTLSVTYEGTTESITLKRLR